ncbi:MAG TPA: hypothetical protein VN999_18460 [Thermoanaerobaculia bacterium]|nr:hypothetical protein [Thermoanaerobaculia bacterium]
MSIVAAVTVVSMADLAGLGQLAAAQEPKASSPSPSTSQQGTAAFDFFRTDPRETHFKFEGALAIPAGFFGEGSGAFKGTVALKGVPLGTFRDHKTGAADVIVERKSTPRLEPPFPSSGKTATELVALSLESVKPIAVRTKGKTQNWDLKVQLSTSRASTGTMTITQRSAQGGGVVSTQLTVYPLFTFVPQGGGQEKRLDVGALKLKPASEAALTIRARNVSWVPCPPGARKVPDLSDNICVGATVSKGGAVTSQFIRHLGRIIAHLILNTVGDAD